MGFLVGAMFGLAAIAFIGAWRGWVAWRHGGGRRKLPQWMAVMVLIAQIGLGLLALGLAVFFLFVGSLADAG